MATVNNMTFQADSLADIYRNICTEVVRFGRESSPRGQKTREVLCPTIVVRHPEDTQAFVHGRNPSRKIAVVEAIQLCGSFADAELMVAASKEFEKYQEPYTQEFHGAYGRRIGNQTISVVNRLQNDPDSRQAVITLWKPELDFLAGKRDYPCTISLQFLIRDGLLHLVTNMRSNDVWLGLAYDLFQFGQLQWTVANMLDVAVGDLVHRPVSLHAYERDFGKIENLGLPMDGRIAVTGFRNTEIAWKIGRGKMRDDVPLNASETWFQETVDELRSKMRA